MAVLLTAEFEPLVLIGSCYKLDLISMVWVTQLNKQSCDLPRVHVIHIVVFCTITPNTSGRFIHIVVVVVPVL